jgi:hypothetical protein
MGSAHHSLREHPIVFAFGEGRFKSPRENPQRKNTGYQKVTCVYWLRRGDLNLLLPSCGAQNRLSLLLVANDFDRYASSARNSAYRFFALLKKLIASLCFLSPKSF